MVQQVGKLGIGHDAQIGADAAAQQRGGLGVPLALDRLHPRERGEKIHDGGPVPVFGADHQVEISDGLLAAAHAAGDLAADHPGLVFQGLVKGCGRCFPFGDQVTVLEAFHQLDILQDLLLGLGAKTLHPGKPVGFSGRLQLLKIGDIELLPYRLHFFRSHAGNPGNFQQSGGDGLLQAVIFLQGLIAQQGGDFICHPLADPFDPGQFPRRCQLC